MPIDYDFLKKNFGTSERIFILMSILIATLFSGFLFYGIIIVLFMNIYLVFDAKKLLIFFTPTLIIVLITNVVTEFRQPILIGLTLGLVYIFVRDFQFNFKSYPGLPRELIIIFSLYLFSLVISTLNSNYILIGSVQILRTIAFITIFYLLTSAIREESDLRLVLYSIITAGVIHSFGIIYDFVSTGFSILNFDSAIQRMGGLHTNVNAVSIVFYVALILSSVFYIISNTKNRYIFLTAAILNFTALLLNNSRSSLLAIFTAVLLLIFMEKRKIFWILISAVLIIIPLLYYLTEFGALVDLYLRLDRASSGRETYWQMAISVFKDNPIAGVGPAVFKYEMYKHLPVELGSWIEQGIYNYFIITDFGHQHNFYLFLVSDLGLLGLLILSVLILLFYFSGVENIKVSDTFGNKHCLLNKAFFVIGIGFFVRGFFESINILSYGWLSGDLPFWIIYFSLVKLNTFKKVEIIKAEPL